MKDNISKLQHFDPTDRVATMRKRHELQIISRAFRKLFPNEKLLDGELIVAYEHVECHCIDIYTVRYKGTILLRRFPEDPLRGTYRYESPLFESKTKINQ